MSQDTSARTKTLSPDEVMDLVRAAIVLAVTVGLTMIVPARVWSGGEPAPAPAIIESSK